MLTRAARRGRVLVFTIGMLIGAGLPGPMTAEAGGAKWLRRQVKLARCQLPKTLVRTDRKTCPQTKFRPPMTVYRACCENRGGRRQCHPFPYCPARSPS